MKEWRHWSHAKDKCRVLWGLSWQPAEVLSFIGKVLVLLSFEACRLKATRLQEDAVTVAFPLLGRQHLGEDSRYAASCNEQRAWVKIQPWGPQVLVLDSISESNQLGGIPYV